jgi:branched-subunit amino acid aminotransferase/4-amino-4-deoxychorismate lyase
MADEKPGFFSEFSWRGPTGPSSSSRDPAAILREHGINLSGNVNPQLVQEVARVVSFLWLEGQIVPTEQFRIDPADEGLLFGKGVWESTRTINGVPWLWAEHITRLQRTAELLGIDVAADRLPQSEQVSGFVRALTRQDVIIRLNVTAGRPGKKGIVWMTASLQPFPAQSVRLRSCRAPIVKDQPYLAWKTFQYASRLRTSQQAFEAGFDTALLLDPDGYILEASHANIFIRFDDGWATPPADNSLILPGTLRQLLLDRGPLAVRMHTIPFTRLADIREAFVTNSNVGVVPVIQIDHAKLAVGNDTNQVIRWLQTEQGLS